MARRQNQRRLNQNAGTVHLPAREVGERMENGLGIVAALVAFAIWQFVIWPLIGRASRRAVSAASDAGRPTADPTSTMLRATAKARQVFDGHVDDFLAYSEADWETFDAGVRSGIEAQIMVVAFSVTLLNISIQDVAYDTGAVDRAKLTEGRNGFPKVKVSDEAFRLALRELWSRFSVPTRMNLDMRYRYLHWERLASKEETALHGRMCDFALRTLTNEFSFGAHHDTGWLDFVNHLAHGRLDEARTFITQAG